MAIVIRYKKVAADVTETVKWFEAKSEIFSLRDKIAYKLDEFQNYEDMGISRLRCYLRDMEAKMPAEDRKTLRSLIRGQIKSVRIFRALRQFVGNYAGSQESDMDINEIFGIGGVK
jgi:hypothetical protein